MTSILKKIGIWFLVLPWGVYIPIWWVLVFTGYYDAKMSPEMLLRTKLFLPADLFLALTLTGAILGIRKKLLWGYGCGFLVSGALIYICIQTGASILAGSLPGDWATHLIVWPYLGLGVIGAFFLYRALRQKVGTQLS